MSIYSDCFPLGLGTSRFPVSGPDDAAGLERSVRIAVQALNAGVSYVDVGHNYSAGMSPQILREAFRQVKKPVSVTAKVMYGMDRTADDARKRVELCLQSMGLEKARFFTCWTIWNYQTFEQIMKKGGIYEGALRLRDEGLIDHICCSLHAPPEDILKILDSGAFEGITISYSMLNAALMQPVLDMARQKDIGVAVMNPLGGGVIAQNQSFFSFAKAAEGGESTVSAALRFVKAHPAVDVVLSGISSEEELEENLRAVREPDPEPPAQRLSRVLAAVSELKGFCTGCKYCEGCPKGIPTAQIMQARNALLFDPVPSYNRESPPELLYNIQVFRKLLHDNGWLPETAENPCIQCGRCERSCTQKLDIISGVQDIYRRAADTFFSRDAHRSRLRELLQGRGYKKVGLYPNGGFSNLIIKLCGEIFEVPEFEWILLNSDPKMWGQQADGYTIHAPGEIPSLALDAILVCTYKFDKDIQESLRVYEQKGVRVERLHREPEMPWVF